MSDKETAPQTDDRQCDACGEINPVWFADNEVWNAVFPERVGYVCPNCFIKLADPIVPNTGWKLVPEVAVECTAPAPQSSELQIWASRARAARQQWLESYGVPISNEFAQFAEAIGNLINLAERAATPQVTPTEVNFCTGDQDCRHTCEPCDHFWRTIAVNPRWSWFTECEKCKIGAPLELQAENYVEGTSEQASPTPDKCPTCSSEAKSIERWPCAKRYGGKADPWHSSASTPEQFPSRSQEKRIRTQRGEKKPFDPRNTGVSLDGGKTIHSKFKND